MSNHMNSYVFFLIPEKSIKLFNKSVVIFRIQMCIVFKIILNYNNFK